MAEPLMFHYTDGDGYKAISSQTNWTFRASHPPGDHERGVYFTTLTPGSNRFSARTRIPIKKQQFVFAFRGDDGLQPIKGGKGAYVFWSPDDYVVEVPRQAYHGPTEALP
jgi:hypothetical protein